MAKLISGLKILYISLLFFTFNFLIWSDKLQNPKKKSKLPRFRLWDNLTDKNKNYDVLS